MSFFEKDKSSSDIQAFKRAVEKISKAELAGSAAVGTALMTAGISIIFGKGLSAALALVGSVGAGFTAMIEIDSSATTAEYYFGRLRYN